MDVYKLKNRRWIIAWYVPCADEYYAPRPPPKSGRPPHPVTAATPEGLAAQGEPTYKTRREAEEAMARMSNA